MHNKDTLHLNLFLTLAKGSNVIYKFRVKHSDGLL